MKIKTIKGDCKKFISYEKEQELKKLAIAEANTFKYKEFNTDYTRDSYAIDRIYYRDKYKEYSEEEKAFLLSNIVFPDNKKFVRTLKDYGYTLDKLKAYLTNYIYFEKLKENKKEVPKKYLKNQDSCNKITNKLKIIIKKIYGIDTYEIAINKINEVVNLTPELFDANDKYIDKAAEISRTEYTYQNEKNIRHLLNKYTELFKENTNMDYIRYEKVDLGTATPKINMLIIYEGPHIIDDFAAVFQIINDLTKELKEKSISLNVTLTSSEELILTENTEDMTYQITDDEILNLRKAEVILIKDQKLTMPKIKAKKA